MLSLPGFAELVGAPILPTTIERTPNGERALDPYSQLFKERIVLLDSAVTPESASALIAQLLWLNKSDQKAPIYMYISSPGGSVSAGLGIYDVMQHIKPEVYTITIGQAASMGAFLLSSGAKGKRFAMPNAEIMIHQPRIQGQGIDGTVTDIDIYTEHLKRTKKRLAQIMADNCGKDLQTLLADTEKDYWMSAVEAKEYGLIDAVIEPEA